MLLTVLIIQRSSYRSSRYHLPQVSNSDICSCFMIYCSVHCSVPLKLPVFMIQTVSSEDKLMRFFSFHKTFVIVAGELTNWTVSGNCYKVQLPCLYSEICYVHKTNQGNYQCTFGKQHLFQLQAHKTVGNSQTNAWTANFIRVLVNIRTGNSTALVSSSLQSKLIFTFQRLRTCKFQWSPRVTFDYKVPCVLLSPRQLYRHVFSRPNNNPQTTDASYITHNTPFSRNTSRTPIYLINVQWTKNETTLFVESG